MSPRSRVRKIMCTSTTAQDHEGARSGHFVLTRGRLLSDSPQKLPFDILPPESCDVFLFAIFLKAASDTRQGDKLILRVRERHTEIGRYYSGPIDHSRPFERGFVENIRR